MDAVRARTAGAQKSKFATRHAGCQHESVLKVRVKDVIYLSTNWKRGALHIKAISHVTGATEHVME